MMGGARSIFYDAAEASSLDQSSIDWFLGRGVDVLDLVSPWPVFAGRVVFAGSRYTPSPSVGDFAFVFAVISGGGIVDAVAWQPTTGRIATRLGVGAMLGEGQLDLDSVGRTGCALPVWRTPVAWLKAKRKGAVIADSRLAAHLLAGLILRPEDAEHARELKGALRVPSPIFSDRAVTPAREAIAA